jgi:hypothetical protein
VVPPEALELLDAMPEPEPEPEPEPIVDVLDILAELGIE